jgi:hypothetical protein
MYIHQEIQQELKAATAAAAAALRQQGASLLQNVVGPGPTAVQTARRGKRGEGRALLELNVEKRRGAPKRALRCVLGCPRLRCRGTGL